MVVLPPFPPESVAAPKPASTAPRTSRRRYYLDEAGEIRLADLLPAFKGSTSRLARCLYTVPGMEFYLTLDLRVLERPTLLIEALQSGSEDTHTQLLDVKLTTPSWGGWTATFLCPGLSPLSPCGRSVHSLFLPPGDGPFRFACRHCHRLRFPSARIWRGRQKKPGLGGWRNIPTQHRVAGGHRTPQIPSSPVQEHWRDRPLPTPLRIAREEYQRTIAGMRRAGRDDLAPASECAASFSVYQEIRRASGLPSLG